MYKRFLGGSGDDQKKCESNDRISQTAGDSNGNINYINEAVVDEVNKCWDVIEKQFLKHLDSKTVSPAANQCLTDSWKTVRVFVSSTFTDFFNEREVLVKKVFPELKEWCEERKIQLIECDLRWGVPKDSNTRDTICACMEELDRCFEENDGKPFFLNLICERYGWVPTVDEVPPDIREQYQWVNGASITLMEILHGAYRTKNPNAGFFVRNPDFIKDLPKEYLSRFEDNNPNSKQHLKVLKEKLKEKFPNQVYPYSCQLTGLTEVEGRKRVKLSGLEEFAESVIKWMKRTITQTYPNQESVRDLNPDEQETEYHRVFMEKISEFVIGRDHTVDVLLSYARGEVPTNIPTSDPAKSFVRDPEFWKTNDDDNMIMCVTGDVGQGKSCVMAKIVREALQKGMPVFYHFVGCTGNSRQSETLVRRMVKALTGLDMDELIKERTEEPLQVYMETLRDELPKLRDSNKEYLLVIDGVNELIQFETSKHLAWLPPRFPGKIRCIVSSASNHPPTIARLKEHISYVLDIGPITMETAKDIITLYLGQYSKKLDAEQIQFIVSKPCSQNPIWLWLLMEELRVFGDYKMLTDKIKNISDSVEKLLSAVISRLINEDETESLQKILCLLAVSKGGLALQDLLNMTGDINRKEPLAPIYWSKIRRLLKPYVRFVGHKEHVVFSHMSISQAIQDNLLTDVEYRRTFHKHLGEYFLNCLCDDTFTIINNLPYHCIEAGMKDSLIEFLRKRKEAANIVDFMRSKYFDHFRCKNLADPVMPGAMPVVMCRSCSLQKTNLCPRLYRNKTVCIICGSLVFPGSKPVTGYYCHSHAIRNGQNKIIGKCVICKMIVSKDKDGKVVDISGMLGQLCTHCGFGFRNKQCCMV